MAQQGGHMNAFPHVKSTVSVIVGLIAILAIAFVFDGGYTTRGSAIGSERDLTTVPNGAYKPSKVTAQNDCGSIIDFPLSEEQYASWYDSATKTTQIFVGDYGHNTIVLHTIDSSLNHTQTTLPLGYSSALLAADLDNDGHMDLVVQGGDPGFGGNAYLDILSAPSWTRRVRLTYPGMKVLMTPTLAWFECGSVPDLVLNPSDFSRTLLQVVQYSAVDDSFEIIDQLWSPYGELVRPAAADFDHDGRMELVAGCQLGFPLFEWQNGHLRAIGLVDSQYSGNAYSIVCEPIPGKGTGLLLGHAEYAVGFQYKLLYATGDNQFATFRTIQDCLGRSGIAPCFATDLDCDGVQEIITGFCDSYRIWNWSVPGDSFYVRCALDIATYDGMHFWSATDLDQNGRLEMASVSGTGIFHVIEASECHNCDSLGRCHEPTSCPCTCHADPNCDKSTDVLDVVQTINIAFRGAASIPDPAIECTCQPPDVNCDGIINILDVMTMIDVAFRGMQFPKVSCNGC
jgi:hypothetical protein